MTTKELHARIGTVALLSTDKGRFQFQVTVHDARMSYGQDQYEVVPVAGSGKTWVDGSRLAFS